MHRFCLSFFLTWLVTLGQSPPVVSAAVPPRSAGGQTLEVPDGHLNQGQVFYVTPGEDTQLAVRSDAPLQRVIATTSRTVGYIVSPFDLTREVVPVLAGAFRLPVVSLGTGSPQVDEMLHGAGFLDAAQHPEITFLLTGVRDLVKTTLEDGEPGEPGEDVLDDVFSYRLSLVGKLEVKGTALDLVIPAEVTFLLSNARTMNRFVGDMMTLRGELEVKPGDFGWKPPHPSFNERVGETLKVDLFLLLNTVSPDRSLDPRKDPGHHTRELKFLTLLRDLDDPQAAYTHGRSYVKEVWDDPQPLHRMAGIVLEESGIRRRDLAFALEAARRAGDLTQESDAAILDTLAQIYYQRGELEAALSWQEKAVSRLEGVPANQAKAMRETLERYQKELR